jgi:hypothetical protein
MEPALFPASPYVCTEPALYTLGRSQVLSGRVYVLFRVYKLCASFLDHISDQGRDEVVVPIFTT